MIVETDDESCVYCTDVGHFGQFELVTEIPTDSIFVRTDAGATDPVTAETVTYGYRSFNGLQKDEGQVHEYSVSVWFIQGQIQLFMFLGPAIYREN